METTILHSFFGTTFDKNTPNARRHCRCGYDHPPTNTSKGWNEQKKKFEDLVIFKGKLMFEGDKIYHISNIREEYTNTLIPGTAS